MKRKRAVVETLMVVMLLNLTACVDGASTEISSTVTSGTAGNIFADAGDGDETGADDMNSVSDITVALPSANLHTETNSWYDKLVEDIEKYTGIHITWEWYDEASYFEQLEQDILSGEVADVVLIKKSEVFLNAAENGLFWEIGPYLEDYDNLAEITDLYRIGASNNGRLYGIPDKSGPVAWGLVYRTDWLKNLELKEPKDWESFCDMLYAFTYNDPDGNGVDDTIGLLIDNNSLIWDIMESWFGVPNVWGIDDKGDLIHKTQTQEYKEAYAAFRELYTNGLINNGTNGVRDFRQIPTGSSFGNEFTNMKSGSTLYDLYNICSFWKGLVKDGMTTEEEQIFSLQAYVDTGHGALCYPSGGDGIEDNLIAVSTQRIKNEEQLKRVLQCLNDMSDAECQNMMGAGWEGVTYTIDEDGYLVGEELSFEKSRGLSTYAIGFSGVTTNFISKESKGILKLRHEANYLSQLKKYLEKENEQNCVINYGIQFVSETEKEKGEELDTMLYVAEIQYITGEIDEAGFRATLDAWWEAGGEKMTEEINALYHAAGY